MVIAAVWHITRRVHDEVVVQQGERVVEPSFAERDDERLDYCSRIHAQPLSGTPTARNTYSGGTSNASDRFGSRLRTSSPIAVL